MNVKRNLQHHFSNTKKIVLASSSLRRRALLRQIGLDFISDASNIEERFNPRLKPRGNAEYIAVEKAKAVAEKYENAIIIAADTFVVINNEIIGKPASETEAKRILQKLSGRMHEVITGYAIIDTQTGKGVAKSVVTKVYFRKLNRKEISEYIASGEPMDKAGAYGMQNVGGIFIERVDGDPFNVVGLPLCELTVELRRFGVTILS